MTRSRSLAAKHLSNALEIGGDEDPGGWACWAVRKARGGSTLMPTTVNCQRRPSVRSPDGKWFCRHHARERGLLDDGAPRP